MARLPTVGGDAGNWGSILNEFLRQGHREDGSLKNTLDVINVKDFGVDPTGVSDSRAAIQSAIDEAKANGGGIVFFPKGIYRIDTSLKLSSSVGLVGVGSELSIILGNNLTVALAVSENITTRYFDVIISNLKFDNQNKGNIGAIGIDFTNITTAHLSNVVVKNVETGIKLSASAFYNHIDNVKVLSTVTGYKITNGANENHFIGGRVQDSTIGMEIDNVSGTRLYGIAFELFTTGIKFLSTISQYTSIEACRFENIPTSGTGIDIHANARAVMISMPLFTGLATNINQGATDTIIIHDGEYGRQLRVSRLRLGTAGVSEALLYADPSTVFFRSPADSTYVNIDANLITARNGLQILNQGKILFGDSINPPDTSFYRGASNSLKTDGNIRVGGNLGVGNAVNGTSAGNIVKKIEIFDGNGNSLGFVPVYDSIT